jgi:MoxR-like ATPase
MAPDDDDDPPEDGPSILERWTRDLGQLARAGQLRRALFRETEINQAVAALKARRSLLLVGPTGVGKPCLGAALPPELGPLVSISTASLMRDTKWLGEWQTKVEECSRKNRTPAGLQRRALDGAAGIAGARDQRAARAGGGRSVAHAHGPDAVVARLAA